MIDSEHHREQDVQRGATLIEIAVIIAVTGIFLGSVLALSSVYQGAKVRNIVTRFESYDSRVAAFRTKYQYLPGDLTLRVAQQSGFTARTGLPEHGDGDGFIEGCLPENRLGCENTLFWRDLAHVRLVNDKLQAATDNFVDGTNQEFLVSQYLPESPFHPITQVFIYPYKSRNHYFVSTVFSVDAEGRMHTSGAVDADQIMAMEDKMDDGLPNSGGVVAMTAPGVLDIGTDSVYACVRTPNKDSILVYNVDAKDRACQISIRSTL